MNTKPSLHKAFEIGLLFMQGPDNERMLLQVCSDFDVSKRELDGLFGKSRKLVGPFDDQRMVDSLTERAVTWSITSEKDFDAAFKKFFRPYKKHDDVQNKPTISKLVLLPFNMDQPIVPNDMGDRS